MKMNAFFQRLSSPRVISWSGFMVGFVYELKLNETTLEYPLSTIAGATLCGIITSFGAEILSSVIPVHMRFIIPASAGASCVYYKYKDIIYLRSKLEGNKKD